jgi:hypothetical protein
MEVLTRYALVNKRYLAAINRCRIYLRVFFLSDIVNIQCDTIEEWEIIDERSNKRHSPWHWPVQQKPPCMMWNKWKAALIEVFTDKTTLSAPMGDWLDTQNHQECELWLSVQEKCIYRQINGEWSQYTQLNFGILRFSKTPRIVPHTQITSHIRIQVTQRTQYFEVAEKVNIVYRQNAGSTPIHNYTLGIGLSFLALPRHIQQLTGDIPALPTPATFDFDEPVDLIIATNGSVLYGVGYHGWVLATKEEEILLRGGGGADDGIRSLMTSYQSELGGLVAVFAVLGTLFRAGTLNIWSIRFICDSESAATAARRPTSKSIFHNTKCDWDLIVTIQDLIV